VIFFGKSTLCSYQRQLVKSNDVLAKLTPGSHQNFKFNWPTLVQVNTFNA